MGRHVPHCRDCPWFVDRYTYGEWGRYRCLHFSLRSAGYAFAKVIPSSEVRTSPKWCPLRLQNLHDVVKKMKC